MAGGGVGAACALSSELRAGAARQPPVLGDQDSGNGRRRRRSSERWRRTHPWCCSRRWRSFLTVSLSPANPPPPSPRRRRLSPPPLPLRSSPLHPPPLRRARCPAPLPPSLLTLPPPLPPAPFLASRHHLGAAFSPLTLPSLLRRRFCSSTPVSLSLVGTRTVLRSPPLLRMAARVTA